MSSPTTDPRALYLGRAMVLGAWLGLAALVAWVGVQGWRAHAAWEASGGWMPARAGNEEPIIEPHPQLGWVHRPNSRVGYGVDGSIDWSIDGNRFRGHDDAPRQAPAGVRRIAVVGDSFTFGNVQVPDTWVARLADRLTATHTLNMGVSGYGVGQMLLWYQTFGAPFDADLVILAIIEEDLQRAKQERFVTGFAVPRFELRDGTLHHDDTPLPPRLSAGESMVPWQAFLRFAATWIVRGQAQHPGRDDEDFSLPFQIVRRFAEGVRGMDREVLVVLLPTPWARPAAGFGLDTFCETHAIPFVDLTGSMRAAAPGQAWDALFLPDHHPNEAGNDLIASLIAAHLHERGWPATAP